MNQHILEILKRGGIKILEENVLDRTASVLTTNKGLFGFYSSKYEFRELEETNIPIHTFGLFPKEVKRLIILFKENLFWIDKDKIPKEPRINRKLKLVILPIPLAILEPFKFLVEPYQSQFIHLHCHTDYSTLDGITQCKSYLSKAKEFGMPAIAITDHGNVSSHMELQMRSKEFGVKPIFGVENYITKDASLKDGDHRSSNHIILLAKNAKGYRNILKLQKFSWSAEHYYYRPRIDFKTLAQHREGLVVLTACLKGLIAKEVLRERLDLAQKRLVWLHTLFGDDLYLEIQMHQIMDEEKDIQALYNQTLLEFSKKLDIATVVTNDVHYLTEEMGRVQSKVIKMKSESDLAETYCDSIWFKNYEDMRDTRNERCNYISQKDFDFMIHATTEIANKCDFEIPTGGLRIPKINITNFPKYKEGFTEEEYLRHRIKLGLAKREANSELSVPREEYVKRIEREVDAFVKMDVISYILIYDDLVRFLKKKGCLCSLRGSANGSVALWLIGLSIVDPIKFDILFERFISSARIEAKMADIDIDLDIAHTFRDMAINYLKEKYGNENICSVGSFNRTQLKAAIKSLARAEAFSLKKKIDQAKEDDNSKKVRLLEEKLKPFSFQEINRITKAMPPTLEEAKTSSVADWFTQNENWVKRYVEPILGNAYAESLHPAGVVISPEPYHYWLPVRTNKLSKDKGGERVFATQWENSHTSNEYLNERGVMVADILGVKTLTIIAEAIKLIEERHGKTFKLDTIPLDDQKVYDSLSKGENIGFFQLGKESLRGLFKKVKPNRIEDLIFLIAADRPGPMAAGAFDSYAARKHGEEDVSYYHHSLKPVLSDTLGVLTYSEHIMRTASTFAGMNPIDSEKMRKIIKAKSKEDFDKFKDRFIQGAIKTWEHEPGIERRAARIWEALMGFSQYAFPKGHATSYAIIANATQFLKVHYPVEFFCAFLDQVPDDEYNPIRGVAIREYDVSFILPHINLSKAHFTIHRNQIVWALASIKGVGFKAAKAIMAAQPFESFKDFHKRVNKRVVNIRVIKALTVVNAFRKFGDRNEIMKKLAKLRNEKFEPRTEDEWNFEMGNLIPYGKRSVAEIFPFQMNSVMSYDEFLAKSKHKRVVIAGTIDNIRNVQSKRGAMSILKVTDMGETYNVVLWNDMVKRLSENHIKLEKGLPVKISGIKGSSYLGEEQITLGKEQECYVKILK
jgi:DNA polymerase-3 subunit alpha